MNFKIDENLPAEFEPVLRSSGFEADTGAVCTNILHFSARVVVTSEDALPLSIVLEELSAARERPMIISMPTTARLQQRYDHRLRNLVQRTGDVTLATDMGVPRSTARGPKSFNRSRHVSGTRLV